MDGSVRPLRCALDNVSFDCSGSSIKWYATDSSVLQIFSLLAGFLLILVANVKCWFTNFSDSLSYICYIYIYIKLATSKNTNKKSMLRTQQYTIIVLACLADACSITCFIIPVQSKPTPGAWSWWDSLPGVVILSSEIIRKTNWIVGTLYMVFTVFWYVQYYFGNYN